MPTQFIHIPPIQRICNRNPSFLTADSIYWVTRTLRHPVAQPAQIERCNKRMADSLSGGHRSPRRDWSASCSSYCSLGTRWRESRTGCPAFLSKFIVIGGIPPPLRSAGPHLAAPAADGTGGRVAAHARTKSGRRGQSGRLQQCQPIYRCFPAAIWVDTGSVS